MTKNPWGFTLVEVLAVMGITILVLAGVSTFFISNQRLYQSGSQQVDLHHALRLTAERVNREVRFGWGLTLLDEDQWDPGLVNTSNYSYIYLDAETRTVNLMDQEGTRPLSEQVVAGISFGAKGNTLLFSIEGVSNTSSFILDSSVRPLNYNGNITVPENPVALRYIPFNLGSLSEPPELDPEPPEPDPGLVEKETRTLLIGVFDKLSGKNKQKTETRTWHEIFVKPIDEINFSFSRTITGQTKNSNFSGNWELLLFDGDTTHTVKTEAIKQPTGEGETLINVTLSDLSIDALQPITLTFNITYNSGNHTSNWIQPVFGDIQMEATFADVE